MGRRRDPMMKDVACGSELSPQASSSSTGDEHRQNWWSADTSQWSQPLWNHSSHWQQPDWWSSDQWDASADANTPQQGKEKASADDIMPQHKWSQPYWSHQSGWKQTSADVQHTQDATDGNNWWPRRAKAAAETETCRADLLEAAEKDQYYNDIDFLRRQEEKDRHRRTAYRHNLKERRWQAWERISMVQNDTLEPLNSAGNKRKRGLSSQVLQVASDLSRSLPKTPEELKQHDDNTPTTPRLDQQLDQSDHDVDSKKPRMSHHEALGDPQLLHLNEWMVGTFFNSKPTDPGLPLDRIERKDAKYRWASYNRIAPRLNRGSHAQSGNDISPPYGIQLISWYHQWKFPQP